MIDKKLIGEAMVRLRGARTQRSVSKRAGVATGTWCQWEKGQRRPREEQDVKILRGLKCSAEDFTRMVWEIQADRFKLQGSALASHSFFQVVELLEVDEFADIDLEELPESAKAVMQRLRQGLNSMSTQVGSLMSDYEALIVALRPRERVRRPPWRQGRR